MLYLVYSKFIVDRHESSQPHGRIDGPIPANKVRSMASVVAPKLEIKTEDSQRAVVSGVNVSKSIAPVAKDSHTLTAWRHRRTSKRVDDGMRRAILARMHLDMCFANDIQLATAESLRVDSIQQEEKQKSISVISKRLAVLNLRRQETPGDGHCQFIAMARLLGFPDERAAVLRQEICDYLETHADEFREFHDGR